MTAAAVPSPPDEIPIAADPWQAWIDAHRDEVARHHGQRIAVHPEHGIVASGKTLEEVSDALRSLGYPTGEDDPIAVDVVPAKAARGASPRAHPSGLI